MQELPCGSIHHNKSSLIAGPIEARGNRRYLPIVSSPDTLCIKIGKLIQFYRLRKELSQFQLGLELNISKDHVGRIERGLTNPTIENIVKLSNFLEIDILLLFTKLDIKELEKIEIEIERLQKEFKNQNKRKF